jgi:hypothetical protein
MRFLAVVLTLSVGVACGVGCGGSARRANSPDDENSEEVDEQTSNGDAEPSAEAEEPSEEDKEKGGARPTKKRRAKHRRRVEAAPAPEPPPVVRKAPPPPVEEPPAEEPAPAPAYVDTESGGDDALEAEARRRCRWKNVAPYRPEWANAISPPVQRKITSKPICPYGTPPAVLRIARQIAVQQTKTKR